MASYNHLFKILLVGDSGVGKTSILTRFAQEKFDTDVSNTIGVDLMVKMMEFRDQTIKLTIWVCSLFAFAVILLTLSIRKGGVHHVYFVLLLSWSYKKSTILPSLLYCFSLRFSFPFTHYRIQVRRRSSLKSLPPFVFVCSCLCLRSVCVGPSLFLVSAWLCSYHNASLIQLYNMFSSIFCILSYSLVFCDFPVKLLYCCVFPFRFPQLDRSASERSRVHTTAGPTPLFLVCKGICS